MKTLRMPLLLLAVTAALVLVAIPARATIIYDNLNAAISGGDAISSFGPLADSFSTGGSAALLSDVKVRVSGASTSPGDITVSLLQDNATAPGSLISVLGSIAAGSLGTNLVYDFGALSIALAANTRYWIQLATQNPTATWPWSLDISGTGVAGEFFANQNGVFASTEGPYLMQVTVDGSVPEPATLALLAFGVIGLGFSRRSKT